MSAKYVTLKTMHPTMPQIPRKKMCCWFLLHIRIQWSRVYSKFWRWMNIWERCLRIRNSQGSSNSQGSAVWCRAEIRLETTGMKYSSNRRNALVKQLHYCKNQLLQNVVVRQHQPFYFRTPLGHKQNTFWGRSWTSILEGMPWMEKWGWTKFKILEVKQIAMFTWGYYLDLPEDE